MKKKLIVSLIVLACALVLASIVYTGYTLVQKQIAKYRMQGYRAAALEAYKYAEEQGRLRVKKDDKAIDLEVVKPTSTINK